MGEGRVRSFSREAGERRHTLSRETLSLERWLCSSPSGSGYTGPGAFGHRTTPPLTLAPPYFFPNPTFVHPFLSVERAHNGSELFLPVIKSLTLLIHPPTRGTGSTRYLQDSISAKQ